MLYKYCKTDGFDILLQSRLKVSSIEKFNDPFEISFGVDKDSALEIVKNEFKEEPRLINEWKHLLDIQNIQFNKSSPEDIVNKVAHFQIRDFARIAKEMREDWNKNLGLVCLSKYPDIIQMWAHYTDNHRGIVVGIEENECIEAKSLITIVYKEMVLFQITASPKNMYKYDKCFQDVISRKEESWGYEKEVRFFRDYNKEDEYYVIPASSIKEIYLGLRSHETTEIVAKSIKQRDEYKHLKIYKMEIDESAYALIPKELW